MKRLIMHHNDADGRCAAAIAGRDAISKNGLPMYVPVDYGIDIPDVGLFDLQCSDEIWLLDFSFETDVMVMLANVISPSQFVWIDHHKTAVERIDSIEDITGPIRGLRSMGVPAACALTWSFCHPGETPWVVKYIADRDMWIREYAPQTHWFHELYRMEEDTAPGSEFWDNMFSISRDQLNHMLSRQGKWLYDSRVKSLQSAASRFGREVFLNIEGHMPLRCLKVNHMPSGDLGQVINDLGYPIAWCYAERRVKSDIQRVNTLYSKEVDVSVIAKANGGGGHGGAAGWAETVGYEDIAA